TLPLVVLGWGGMLGALPAWTGWLQAALATATLWFGRSLLAGALRRARHAGANMDTLVTLGVSAAYGASWAALLGGGHLHFEAAGMIVTLVLLGRWLEARAQRRTGEALRALLDLAPQVAHRLGPGDEVEHVPLAALRPGDR